MRVLLLGDVNSSHFVKWAQSLVARGVEVRILTLETHWKSDSSVLSELLINPIPGHVAETSGARAGVSIRNIVTMAVKLRGLVRSHHYDIIHAHYATSYGLLGTLLDRKKLVVSFWGSDIFEFPKKSTIHRFLIQWVCSSARVIMATSNYMAEEVSKYTKKNIVVTPFGVDCENFRKFGKEKTLKAHAQEIRIGTVKLLEPIYNIHILVAAFDLLRRDDFFREKNLKLEIAGYGSQQKNLQLQCQELGIEDAVTFHGRITYSEVPVFLNSLDIFAVLSERESFGVSLIEALACELPVVASRIGGFMEIMGHCECGVVVSPGSAEEAADGIMQLCRQPEVANQMSRNGRELVLREYENKRCVDAMIREYGNFKQYMTKNRIN